MRKALAEKILCLGIDGMDPMLTRKFIAQGLMPNTKKIVERGAQREDLAMLGGVPTITPPMWTTLATGTNPGNHGITCFWNQDHENLDTMVYAFDSRKCKNEQLWNVFAEAGKKTLVWHWPGSSWPPTSNSENLYVVDGVQPAAIGSGNSGVDWAMMIVADEKFEKYIFKPKASNDTGAGCIIEDLDDSLLSDASVIANVLSGGTDNGKGEKVARNIILTETDGELAIDECPNDVINTPIKPANGWMNAPEDAYEFAIDINGVLRRWFLILKNEDGIYDRVGMYKTKKDSNPLVILKPDVLNYYIIDDTFLRDGSKGECSRTMKLLDVASDGKHARIVTTTSLDIHNDTLWHPKSFYKEVTNNVGYVKPITGMGHADIELVEKMLLPLWEGYCQWQADALNYCINEADFEIIFSHIHEVDACGHNFWYLCKERAELGHDVSRYMKAMEETYRICDDYIGRFAHLIDEGWALLIFSDHGLLTTPEDHNPLIGDAFGCNAGVMQELGYTVLKKDADGNVLKEVDWEKTRAVATRGTHIWINLKGRNPHGIVEPEDKYELEAQIISDLYNYRHPFTGKRCISIAMRNKDAVALGAYGPECGDIMYWLEEGYNRIHGDALATMLGHNDTSVAPIFIAAGAGLKEGVFTDRIIREVDFAPTVAVLGGVRMPKHCEGAPAYQIFSEEF